MMPRVRLQTDGVRPVGIISHAPSTGLGAKEDLVYDTNLLPTNGETNAIYYAQACLPKSE